MVEDLCKIFMEVFNRVLALLGLPLFLAMTVE